MGSTGRKALGYGFGLIALYLAVSYSSGFSQNVKSVAGGSTTLVKAFQGR